MKRFALMLVGLALVACGGPEAGPSAAPENAAATPLVPPSPSPAALTTTQIVVDGMTVLYPSDRYPNIAAKIAYVEHWIQTSAVDASKYAPDTAFANGSALAACKAKITLDFFIGSESDSVVKGSNGTWLVSMNANVCFWDTRIDADLFHALMDCMEGNPDTNGALHPWYWDLTGGQDPSKPASIIGNPARCDDPAMP